MPDSSRKGGICKKKLFGPGRLKQRRVGVVRRKIIQNANLKRGEGYRYFEF